jgi:hypothetical protein
MPSDVATFREIGVKQSLRQMILLFPLLCPPEHAMIGRRVWCHQNAIVMKLDAKTPSDGSHIVIHGLRTFPTPELARTISFPVHSLGRHFRIQLKGRQIISGAKSLPKSFNPASIRRFPM